jgi:tRNA (guanosine-2'-O-)-methyltransferase
MRRSTPGLLGSRQLVDERIARAEAHDPEMVVRLFEPMVSPARIARLHEVIGRRLASVSAVFDRPYDPHNGAAVVRSCEAFGVQDLHIVELPDAPFSMARSVAKSAEKWIDVTCHAAAPSVIAWARATGTPLVATHPDGELTPADLARMPRLGLVLGNERDGIHPELALACSARVRVPMRGFVESLNVSVTAAILLHAATQGREGDLDAATRRRLYARGLYLSVAKAEAVLVAMLGPTS